MIAMPARICRAHFDGLPLRANVQAESDLKCTHAPRLPGRAAALLAPAALLMQSFGCVTAEAAQTARCFARTCRAHFSGLLLCPATMPESDRKCTLAPRLPARAAALLACGCVAGAIVRMCDCWSRANGAVSAYMPRAFSLAACFCAPATVPGSDLKCTHAPWLPARAAASLSPEAVLAASERWCYCLEPRK